MAQAAQTVCCGTRVICEDCDARHLAVCHRLAPEHLPQLAALAAARRVAPGKLLFEEGDLAEEVFTVTFGMLKVFKMLRDGRRRVIGFLVPGDFLGLAFGRTYVYSAEAVSPVTVCRFRREQFMSLLEVRPELELEILGRISTELAAAQDQMLLLGRKTARERLATFLLHLARRRGLHDGDILELPMSRADIADNLGLTIETVSRTFSSLRKDKVIELKPHHDVLIPRFADLEQVGG